MLALTKTMPKTVQAITSAIGRHEIRQIPTPDDGIPLMKIDGLSAPIIDHGL